LIGKKDRQFKWFYLIIHSYHEQAWGAALKVTVFGSAFVGLVTDTCLAESGHRIICVDVDEEKIDRLNHGWAQLGKR